MNSKPATNEQSRKFELSGSKAHYAPTLDFTITSMTLEVRPDFGTKTIYCSQRLEISPISTELNILALDASELLVDAVHVDGISTGFKVLDEKLLINLERPATRFDVLLVSIVYHTRPRKGFYFIGPDEHNPDKKLEAWTQGETNESRYWFPCVDHPIVKFSTEIIIQVPEGFAAISNGKLIQVHRDENQAQSFRWVDKNPHPAYLTSVVIGRYAEVRYDELIECYVPEEFRQDADRSFEKTPQMVNFFEEYFGTKYPFDKYSQVAVQDFVYGGMENSSCTTLTLDTLHDSKAHLDFTSEHLVSHELAHQWFGDLVTCRDWQHIWLNEGFATYCEALYWESTRGNDEFLYYVMQTADDYLEEASNRYSRPIVTKVYKHPDDLFDRHTYEKGGMVLHMLRHKIGDIFFRQCIKTYLDRFGNSTAETDDLRKIIELETGQSLQQFFDQWIYRAGHPQLKVQCTSEGDGMKIKVEQTQEGDPFEFPLEISTWSGTKDGRQKETVILDISDKETVFQLQLPRSHSVEWISIDPEFKLLKNISVKAPTEFLLNQLRYGSTVIEKIEAVRALAGESRETVVDALKDVVLAESFWGVGAEAAKAIGATRTDYAFSALKDCLLVNHPKVHRAVVKAIGEFRKPETIETLRNILQLGDKSYFVESETATAIGKTRDDRAIPLLKQALETKTFQSIVAQGAINGLKEFRDNQEIAKLLIEKSKSGNHHRIREAATFALGNFLPGNVSIFGHLKTLLTDKWFRVRINACRAFAEAEWTKAIPDLSWVAEHDLDHRVRRVAEECALLIRQASTKPKELEHMREELDKIKSRNLELLQKMDRLEREIR